MQKSVEIFPLVDADGNTIGRATRQKCHDGSKLLHPVVHLHLFNSKGELFLQKRSSDKDIQPNRWDSSASGHVDYGEAPYAAVLREAFEELGISLSDVIFIDKYIIETDQERELSYCYRAVWDDEITIDTVELSDGRFWTLSEIAANLKQNIFTQNFEADFLRFYSKQAIASTAQ